MATKPEVKSGLVKQGQTDSATPAPATTGTVTRVRKITTKLFQKIPFGTENGAKIAGTIRGERSRTGQYGEYFAFSGDFRLIVGGNITIANELILPAYPESILHDGFTAAFNSLPKGVQANPEATFACVIWRKDDSANTKNARGFTWEVDFIHSMKTPDVENDHLLKLLA